MKITEILLEGGGTFKNDGGTIRIARELVHPTVAWLETIIGVPLLGNMLGSTGQKETSGDLDLGIDPNKYDKNLIVSKLKNWAEKNNLSKEAIVRKFGTRIAFRTPISGNPELGYVQTDLMFLPNLEFAKWSMKLDPTSAYKCMNKNDLLILLGHRINLNFNIYKGLTNPTTKETVYDNPDKIAKVLISPSANKNDLKSVETVLAAIKKSPNKDELLDTVKDYLTSLKHKTINTYMRYIELNETTLMEAGSRGIFVRTQEAASGKSVVFKNSDGKSINAVGNYLLPEKGSFYENDTVQTLPAKAKKLPPMEQKKLLKTGNQKLMDALEQYKISAKISDANWHIVNNAGRAAMITLWTNEKNQVVAYVKLFQSKSLSAIPFFWSNSDFAKDTGFAIENAAQQKAELNLKPSTVVGTNQSFNIEDLLEQVTTNIATHTELPPEVITQVPALLKNVAAGFSEPIANAAQYMNSYEVDLGEVAAPIAVLTGHFISGAYQQVDEQLLKPLGSGWDKIEYCSFPMAGNEQLVDSYLHINSSTKLSISSKNKGGGAAASVTSLTSAIEKNPERYEDLRKQKKYKYLFNVLNLLKGKSAVDGPLELGVMYEIIDKADQKKIKEAIADPHATKKDVTKKLQKLLTNTIYKPNIQSPNYMIGYHLLTTVAYMVVEHLNSQEKLITGFFKEILSRSNMIQVKTVMKTTGTGLAYKDFNIIWPPVFEGSVKFQASKNYSASSAPGGKICFKIN